MKYTITIRSLSKQPVSWHSCTQIKEVNHFSQASRKRFFKTSSFAILNPSHYYTWTNISKNYSYDKNDARQKVTSKPPEKQKDRWGEQLLKQGDNISYQSSFSISSWKEVYNQNANIIALLELYSPKHTSN